MWSNSIPTPGCGEACVISQSRAKRYGLNPLSVPLLPLWLPLPPASASPRCRRSAARKHGPRAKSALPGFLHVAPNWGTGTPALSLGVPAACSLQWPAEWNCDRHQWALKVQNIYYLALDGGSLPTEPHTAGHTVISGIASKEKDSTNSTMTHHQCATNPNLRDDKM